MRGQDEPYGRLERTVLPRPQEACSGGLAAPPRSGPATVGELQPPARARRLLGKGHRCRRARPSTCGPRSRPLGRGSTCGPASSSPTLEQHQAHQAALAGLYAYTEARWDRPGFYSTIRRSSTGPSCGSQIKQSRPVTEPVDIEHAFASIEQRLEDSTSALSTTAAAATAGSATEPGAGLWPTRCCSGATSPRYRTAPPTPRRASTPARTGTRGTPARGVLDPELPGQLLHSLPRRRERASPRKRPTYRKIRADLHRLEGGWARSPA